jgi:hypothetical protein
MKNRIIILLVFCFFAPVIWATKGCDQRISPDDFKNRQKAFITEKAELTKQEAAKFFPIYLELQDKKKDLNDQIFELTYQERNEALTEEQYKAILAKIHELRVAQNKLDVVYHEKFTKILSYVKIYRVQKAEMRFHRELLKMMNKDRPYKDKSKGTKDKL